MPPYYLLCTKKITPALITEAASKGVNIVEKEFISVTPVISSATYNKIKDAIESGIHYMVFTSANAASIVCSYLNTQAVALPGPLKIYSLAGKTRESLKACFPADNIRGKANNARELAEEIIKEGIRKIVFCCGNKRRNELPDQLRDNGMEVVEIIVYETKEVPLSGMEKNIWDAVLFFSPSAVSSFFQFNTPDAHTVCFAIGETTAAAIKKYSRNNIVVAEHPDEKVLIQSVYRHFSL